MIIDIDTTKNSSLVLVMIGSMSVLYTTVVTID